MPRAETADVTRPGRRRATPAARAARHARVSYALVALLTLAGLGYSLALGGTTRFPDERDYLAIAASLVHGGVYGFDAEAPNAMRPPGYPILIAPAAAAARALAPVPDVAPDVASDGTPVRAEPRPRWFAPDVVAGPAERALTVHAVRTLQFLALGLSALALASLAGFSPGRDGTGAAAAHDAPTRGALGCAMLVGLAGYPVLIYTAGTLFPQTAILALATLVLWLLERGRTSLATAVGIGLLCGAVAEVSPTALTLAALAPLHAALSPRWRARHVVAIALAAALLPGAWLARNHVVLGETILFSRNLAYNLDNAVLELDPREEADVRAREPDDAIGYGTERLLQLVGEPAAYFRRLGDFFAWRNRMQVTSESSPVRDLVMLASYSTLLALVALRIALARREPLSGAERSVLLLYAMTAAFHALVFVRIRYRLPFDFLLLLPALNAVLIAATALRPRGGASRAPSTTAP